MILDCSKIYNQERCLYNFMRGGSSTGYIETHEITETPIHNLFMYFSLTFLGGIFLTETFLLGNLFRKYFSDLRGKFLSDRQLINDEDTTDSSDFEEETDSEDAVDNENTVIIVRGVPGIGKKSYVYEREKVHNRNYSICSYNDYFKKDGKFIFDARNINKAEQVTFNKFLLSIRKRIPKIYVVGSFNEVWMYENFLNIANLCGYNIKIVELQCLDELQLYYFNTRSNHNVPKVKSQKLFKNWENDSRAWIQKPYIEDECRNRFNADRIIFNNRRCMINSDSDGDSDRSNNFDIRYSNFEIGKHLYDNETSNELLTQFYDINNDYYSETSSDFDSEDDLTDVE